MTAQLLCHRPRFRNQLKYKDFTSFHLSIILCKMRKPDHKFALWVFAKCEFSKEHDKKMFNINNLYL